MPPQSTRRLAVVEIALIFAAFALQGAWPVPDVNEPHYLGKAIHYWNPDWLRGDFFMESADTHTVFYFTFGWLSLWLWPTALAWTGRIITWLLLAWSWRRLSVAVVPRPWWSVLTATLFGCLMERCHMAGEWVIGGVEAKGFAYVLVFLGLEALVRNRWNRALMLCGAAAAFHVLVGGWAAVALGFAWLWINALGVRSQPPDGPPALRTLWPGMLVGMLLALLGVIPALMTDAGVDRDMVHQAHQLYVFERLPHHLVLWGMRWEYILRFAVLWAFWLAIGRAEKGTGPICRNGPPGASHKLDLSPFPPEVRRLRAFIAGAVAITCVGVAVNLLVFVDRPLAAELLRYYWFRLSDVAVPLGVALEGTLLLVGWGYGKGDRSNLCEAPGTDRRLVRPFRQIGPVPFSVSERPSVAKCLLAAAIVVAAFHVGDNAIDRATVTVPRSHRIADYPAWREACDWVARSGEIPPNARFLTPRHSQTFKWYTGRSEVATWKDVPQDSPSIIEWWSRMETIHATGNEPPEPRWHQSLSELSPARLRELGKQYHAEYAIVEIGEGPLDLPVVYRNRTYAIYRLD